MTDPTVDGAGTGGAGGAAGVGALRSRLAAVRGRARWMLIVAGVGVLVCAALAAALSAGLLDYLVRLPSWFRMVMLIGGVGAAVVGVRKWVLPGWRFSPSLTEVALRLEKSDVGQKAGLTGLLASGLELADSKDESPQTRKMALHVVTDAVQRFSVFKAAEALSPTRVRHTLLTLSICILATAAIGLASGVQLFGVGIQRVLTPWANVQWPKRTGVSDAMTATVHPLGTALPLRAAVTRTDRAQGQTRVAAKYRVISEEGTTPVARVLLTGQGRSIGLGGDEASPASGELFERLIEPAAFSTAAQAKSKHPAELEYWFETDDDRTESRRIKLVEPPAIASASLKVTPPAYVAGVSDPSGKAAFVTGALDVGAGNDQKAIVGPVLAGSEVELSVKLNKVVPTPPSSTDGESESVALKRTEWLAATMPGPEWGPGFTAAFDGAQWTLKWTAAKSLRLPVRPVDEFGLKARDEAAYSIDVVDDRSATAAVIEPREDEPVLATAVIDITGEGRDDVGVSGIELSRQMARAARGSIGAAPEAVGEVSSLATGKPTGSGTQASVSYTLEIGKIEPPPQPGEEVWVTAMVTDNYEIAGARHEAAKSLPRKLRIIKEEDLVAQIRTELSAVRKIAMRLDEEQGELKRTVEKGSVTAEDRHRQAALTQRIATQDETIQRLTQRAERNRLSDDSLTGLLKDLSDLMQGAAKDSQQAAGQMDAAAREQGQQPDSEQKTELSKEQAEPIEKAQESVRDQLGRIAQALDRGEDSWLASRALQRVLQQQKDLKAQTDRVGEQTMGKKPEDLSPQERAELAQIAERQKRLSDQAAQAIDQLAQRADQMKKADAAQAEAMKKAAERGREQQVPQKMEDAAKNAEKNQTSEASREQQEAIDALEQMTQDMNDAKKNRDAQLRRTLADVIQSLERLIGDQNAALTAFAAARPDGKFDGLDAPMITLHGNTEEVAEKARGDRSLAKIAETLDKAAEWQSSAVQALRASPVPADAVDKGEKESLRLLMLARDEAKKSQDDADKRDQDRKRDELKKVYREVLELQVGVQGDTEPFVGKAVERRDRTKVRALGERQEDVRVRLEKLKKDTADLADAKVFDFAHQRLDGSTGAAGKKLRAAIADKSVARNQDSAIKTLKSLVEALNDQSLNDDEFKEEDSGGGSGGGGGQGGGQKKPLIPPLVELKLLRGMQQEAADTTRSVDDAKQIEEVGTLGDLQKNLAERGKELVKQLEQQQQPKPVPKPEKE